MSERESLTKDEKKQLWLDAAAATRHLARAVMDLYQQRPMLVDHESEGVLDKLLAGAYHDMNQLGDMLNNKDACDDGDEFTDSVFIRMHKYFGEWSEEDEEEEE